MFHFQELFFKYSWNNFLHTQVEKCITTVLNNPPTEEDGEQCTPLVDVVSLLLMFAIHQTVNCNPSWLVLVYESQSAQLDQSMHYLSLISI